MKTTLVTLKKHASHPAQLDAGFDTNSRGTKTLIFYTHVSQFVSERFVHDVMRLDYEGWFTNEHGETYKDGSGLARGVVAHFPARPGFPDGWNIAGYHWRDNDEFCWFPDVYDNTEDAARMADEHARVFAEAEREHNTKFNAARDLESKIDDAFTRLRECLALRHKACMIYVRDEAHELIEKIKDMHQTLQTEYADYT